MYCSLCSVDRREEFHILKDNKTRSTTGSTVSSIYRLRDINQREGGYFVFPDLSVRMEGDYCLKFSLFEVVGPKVFFRSSIYSNKFTVHAPKKFPGMDESTLLSRNFAEQGLKIRIRNEMRNRKRKGSFDEACNDDTDRQASTSNKPSSTTRGRPKSLRDAYMQRSDPDVPTYVSTPASVSSSHNDLSQPAATTTAMPPVYSQQQAYTKPPPVAYNNQALATRNQQMSMGHARSTYVSPTIYMQYGGVPSLMAQQAQYYNSNAPTGTMHTISRDTQQQQQMCLQQQQQMYAMHQSVLHQQYALQQMQPNYPGMQQQQQHRPVAVPLAYGPPMQPMPGNMQNAPVQQNMQFDPPDPFIRQHAQLQHLRDQLQANAPMMPIVTAPSTAGVTRSNSFSGNAYFDQMLNDKSE
jgi:hypothetical protein